MATVHLIEGPVGAGKSTYAQLLGLQLRSTPLILDTWFQRLYEPDKPDRADPAFWPWYAARKARCIDQIWDVTLGLLCHQEAAILELGLLQSAKRMAFADQCRAAGVTLCVHILNVPTEERWRRVEARNTAQDGTFVMHVTRPVFDMASAVWDPPTEAEMRQINTILVEDSLLLPAHFTDEKAP